MQFRKPEWDVPRPTDLHSYWSAWNENDLDRIPTHLNGAVTDEVEWNDPNDSFIGIDQLEALMRQVRSTKPQWTFEIASKLDYHHHRYRYRWDLTAKGRTLMEGLDIVTVDPTGLIQRVDGFFGHPTPIPPPTPR